MQWKLWVRFRNRHQMIEKQIANPTKISHYKTRVLGLIFVFVLSSSDLRPRSQSPPLHFLCYGLHSSLLSLPLNYYNSFLHVFLHFLLFFGSHSLKTQTRLCHPPAEKLCLPQLRWFWWGPVSLGISLLRSKTFITVSTRPLQRREFRGWVSCQDPAK